MTKEELKQEAEEKYFNHKMMEFQGFYNRHYYYLGYLDSAEPREKRIAELEKEIAELDMVTFTEMIVAFFKKDEFKDFIGVVSKLFK